MVRQNWNVGRAKSCKVPEKFSAISGHPPARSLRLDAVTLTGEAPQLPSSFRVAAAAQASVATGLAAAQV